MLSPSAGQWIDTSSEIRDVIIAKARRYRSLDRPSVIAVNALSRWSVDREDVLAALFGRATITVNIDDPAAVPTARRVPDGVWTSASAPRYTRNSAVLVAHSLSAWSLGASEVRLYHNPWASRPLTSCLSKLPQAVAKDGKMSYVKGLQIPKLFGLPQAWPKQRSAG
jgi:hypothetical protein